MTAPNNDLLVYASLRQRALDHPVRHAEAPVEHAISLPLPTLRWGAPGYACFAGPAVRAPRQTLQLAVPDRWWLLDPRRAGLVVYGLTAAIPFTESRWEGPVTVTPSGRSLADVQEDLKLVDDLMDVGARAFLQSEDLEATTRQDLAAALLAYLPTSVLPWYRALVPDFFAWIEDGEASDV